MKISIEFLEQVMPTKNTKTSYREIRNLIDVFYSIKFVKKG